MKKINFIIFLLILTAAALRSQVKFDEGTFQQMLDKAKSENKILMVDFFTDWCKWCIELDMKVYSDPEVASFAGKNFISYKIDAEKGEGPGLKEKYRVPGYPTIVFLRSDGTEIDRIVGYFPLKKFFQIMKDYNSGINTFDYLNAKLEENPDDISSNFKIGEKFIDLGEKEHALQYFRKIADTEKENKSGYLDDAELYLAYINEDINVLKSFEEKFPESDRIKDSYIYLADLYFSKNKDNVSAEKAYKAAFEKFGNDDNDIGFAYGQFLISRIYAISSEKEASKDMVKSALILCDDCMKYVAGSVNEASVYYYRANFYYKLGDKEKANDAIDKAIKIFNRKTFREFKEKINSL